MLRTSLIRLTIVLGLAFAVLVSTPAYAAPLYTFTVDSNGDQPDDSIGNNICHTAANTCTLRAAIQESNASSGRDNIVFNIPSGGIQTIQPASAMPGIVQPLTLDASTQPGCATYPCVELSGDSAGLNPGLVLSNTDIVIRGLIIGGFSQNALEVNQPRAVIQGNYIGTDITGSAAHPNGGAGISITSDHAQVGGVTAAERNVISGNTGAGIAVLNSPQTITGNYIGTDATGSRALGNSLGIVAQTTAQVQIGGNGPGEGNVISGNHSDGISLSDGSAFDETISGNLIGTDATGTAAVGNEGHGIHLTDTTGIQIGSLSSASGNVISGNQKYGIYIEGTSEVSIAGNLIGTDRTGMDRVGNEDGGVFSNTQEQVILYQNLISANLGAGLELEGDSAQVLANKIGVTMDGAPLANIIGILITGNHNTIGQGLVFGAPVSANIIANNFGGVLVQAGASNKITGNSIYDNFDEGIRLNAGANNDQPAPALTDATQDAGIHIHGTINAAANSDYRLEFFATPACDEGGAGEGKTFLGSAGASFTTSGVQSFDVTVDASAAAGQVITATATDFDDNTSQFSNCVPLETPATTCTSTPAAPATLLPPGGSTVFVRQVPLDWSDVQCATTYNVQVRRTGKTGPKADKKAGLAVSNYTTKELATGQNYVWRVRSCNAVGCGPWSGWKTFRVKRNASLVQENGAWWSMNE